MVGWTRIEGSGDTEWRAAHPEKEMKECDRVALERPPAQDGSAARNRFICYDPAEHRAGVALGFVPEVNLVVGDRIPLDASKYYAVVRGRFVGVFATS